MSRFSDGMGKFEFLHIDFLKDVTYIILDRGGREGKREAEKHQLWLPLAPTLPGTWPTTQACALTGNQTSDPLVHRPAFNPLSHTSQGMSSYTLLIKAYMSPSLGMIYK